MVGLPLLKSTRKAGSYLSIVENAGADRLTRMGYCTYQDRSTHAMGNLNAYTLSVCLRNHFNSPEIPDSSHVRLFRTTEYPL